MSQPLVSYSPDSTHPPLRSPLLVMPPDAVPSVDELEATQAELKQIKQLTLERARKAAGDLRIIESEMKKMRDLEKGKARALPPHKVKREPSYTPSLDQEERSFSPSVPSTSVGAPSSSAVPVINVTTPLPSKVPPEMRKLKKKDKDKKRKRDEESDGEHDMQRPRKVSPHPTAHKDHHYKPSKLSTVSHSKSGSGLDWTLPTAHPLIPQRPVSIPTLPAGPRKPIEVKEDFSKAKAPPSQVPITTFYASVEPWIRQIREEDVGWLEYDGDTVGPYVTPELGRHYTEQWEEEDTALYGGVPSSLDFSNSRNAAAASSSGFAPGTPLPKWDASSLTEADLVTDKGLGPVTERLVTALLHNSDQSTWKNMREAEDAYEARIASGSGINGVSLPKEKILVADFEERVKDTIRFYGLLDGEPDLSQVVDDPISTALRQAQRQLREVAATNKARRARLAEIARDRLAYQEYVDTRDALDKNINAMFAKLQKKDGPKASKKKKKGDAGGAANGAAGSNGAANGMNGNGGAGGGAPVPLPNPASLGLGPDTEGALVVPEALRQLVDTRRQWVSVIGGGFEEVEARGPGRVRGLPPRSVFGPAVEEEARRALGRADEPSGSGSGTSSGTSSGM
ncbi:histone acetyltransferases subunit 3-domain-containing protein [Phellopilus nigrolimitatus]|nr:histone acetyltransferases subunit 3-domain-containing protein [Phellopilus nigrolimitatus]